MATVLNRLGVLARARGELLTARTLHEQSLALHHERGDVWGIGITLNYLAQLAKFAGDDRRAADRAAESLRTLRPLGMTGEAASALVLLAEIAGAGGRYATAVRILGAVVQLYVAVESWRPPDRASFEYSVAVARAALGDDAFGAAWAMGQLLTLDQAFDEALRDAAVPGSKPQVS